MLMTRSLFTVAGAAIVTLLVAGCGLSSQNRGPDAAPVALLPGAEQISFAAYRSPLRAEVIDRRFRTRDAMFLANEMNETGFPFFERAAASRLVGADPEFLYLTTVESYWYSRYNMSALVSESRLGLHVVDGPYVTDWALREGRSSVNRNRGEFMRSNKGALLQEIIPMYQARTGFPRRFEESSPLMLSFASGDPHYSRAVDTGTMFESEENRIRRKDLRRLYGDDLPEPAVGMGRSGNGMWKARINYRENFLSLRWDHAAMEHAIDLGAEGQLLTKEALWVQHFFQSSHHRGRFLGNDPEQGFRGAMINLMAVSKLLMLKTALLSDGHRLLGADPREVVPGTVYFPHRVGVRMREAGDLPPRPEAFVLEDATSQLFDQASLLWGLTEYYHFADPRGPAGWRKVFGSNPPYDGSIMEQKYIVLAEGLADLIVANLDAMHATPEGVLASTWTPETGRGAEVKAEDLSLAVVALASYVRRLPASSAQSARARRLLVRQAEFLQAALVGPDGAVAPAYDLVANHSTGATPTLLAQGMVVRALLAAREALQEESYLATARRAYDFMNRRLWDARTGVYRSTLDAEVTEYTPLVLGAAIGAMREMILATSDSSELARFKRFWVQGVDGSGIQQAEYEETGERDFHVADMDHDGIPRINLAGGAHGIAPVFASRVRIATPLTAAVAVSPAAAAAPRP